MSVGKRHTQAVEFMWETKRFVTRISKKYPAFDIEVGGGYGTGTNFYYDIGFYPKGEGFLRFQNITMNKEFFHWTGREDNVKSE